MPSNFNFVHIAMSALLPCIHSFHSAPARFSPFLLAVSMMFATNATAEPTGYTLTKQYGSVMFRVLQEDYIYLLGRFDDFEGELSFDPDNLEAASLRATVYMDSVNMADSSISELLVSSSVWFNSSLYPEATFETESVTVTGDHSVDFHGQLEFVGVLQPWTLSATFRGGSDGSLDGSTIGMTARGSFRRTDFGLDQYMNVAADEVEIEVNVKFNRD